MQTIRQGIRTDTEVELLLTEGDKLVGDVSTRYELLRKAAIRLSELKQSGVRIAKKQVDEIEGEVAFDIAGDKSLKNSEQRHTELNRRLKHSDTYQTAKSKLRSTEQTESQINQEIVMCEHDIKIARNYLSVWQSRMEVIAGLSGEQQEHRHHFTAGLNVTLGGNNGEEKT